MIMRVTYYNGFASSFGAVLPDAVRARAIVLMAQGAGMLASTSKALRQRAGKADVDENALRSIIGALNRADAKAKDLATRLADEVLAGTFPLQKWNSILANEMDGLRAQAQYLNEGTIGGQIVGFMQSYADEVGRVAAMIASAPANAAKLAADAQAAIAATKRAATAGEKTAGNIDTALVVGGGLLAVGLLYFVTKR
jgi:hypothetical protein